MCHILSLHKTNLYGMKVVCCNMSNLGAGVPNSKVNSEDLKLSLVTVKANVFTFLWAMGPAKPDVTTISFLEQNSYFY